MILGVPHADSSAYPAPVAFVLEPWDHVPFVYLLDHQLGLIPVVKEELVLEVNGVSVVT